jgi:hypothetical protein
MNIPACKDGCGLNRPSFRLLFILEKLDDQFPGALRIESLCRCKAHNASPQVGGGRNSSHLPIWDDLERGSYESVISEDAEDRSCGADVHIKDVTPLKVSALLRAAVLARATGIGVHPWGLHIDVKPRRWPLLIWKPKAGGGYEYLFNL